MLALTFQIGSERLALDIRRVREVVPRVHLQRVAGNPDWLAGLFVHRGRVVPVIDLHRLLQAGECPQHLSTRIILVPLGEDGPLVGLLAAQVADIREVPTGRCAPAGANATGLATPGARLPDLGPILVDEAGMFHLVDLDRLLPAPVQELVQALPGPRP
jgi:chemotaxis-related protein WspB